MLAHFPTTFGTSEVLNIPSQPGDRIGAILSLYRRQLKSKAKFVGRFDMHGRKDQKTYSLFFASNSPKGFEKMKEAMWSVDKAEGGKFSDFEPGAVEQTTLFGWAALGEEMLARFRGQRVPMSQVEQFVIEQTDYLPQHARSVLKDMEDGGRISVEPVVGYKRRKGTFKSDKVNIAFPA